MPIPAAAITGGLQALGGLAQSIFGGGQANRAQKRLEKMISGYKPDEGIRDYYSKALNRYNANPYTSPLFNYMSQKIGAGTAQGINALQDRRSVLAGLPSLIQNQNDALLKTAAEAEGQKGQQLAQLGGATQMKAQEDKYKFENMANLLGQKASGGNMIANSGYSNIFGGLNNVANSYMVRDMYRTPSGNTGG